MKLKLCPSGKYWWQNKWKPFTTIDELLLALFGKTPKELGIQGLALHPGIKKKTKVSWNGKTVELEIEVTLCPHVAKGQSKYYESILQIKNATPEVLEFVATAVEKVQNKGIYITKHVLKPRRADLFLTDQTFTKRLAHKIQGEYGGTIQLHPKLFSKNKQSGKQLFRLTVLLDLPKIKKNDVVVVDGKLYRVKSVRDRLHLVDVSGKKTSVPYAEYSVLEKKKTKVSKVYPSLEIIDPETYQSVEVRNPNQKLKLDQNVTVAYREGWWLV